MKKLLIMTCAAFTGLIDDVRITSGALDPSEFMQANERTEILPGLMIKVK